MRKPCTCNLCKLSRVIQRIEKKCTPKERVALEMMWCRMEDAENEIGLQKAIKAIEEKL